jgi:hypothetical protein
MNFEELLGILGEYRNTVKLDPKYLFRGQARASWKSSLTPSFGRLANAQNLTRAQALRLEGECVNLFSIAASRELPIEETISLTLARFRQTPQPDQKDSVRVYTIPGSRGLPIEEEVPDGHRLDFLGWFTHMQHYNAPTRNLDWTMSPYVALYFACREEEDDDAILWIADFVKADSEAKKRINYREIPHLILDTNAQEVVVFSRTLNSNQRVEYQQGRFSFCTNPLANHEPILHGYGALKKFEIPSKLKPEVMSELRRMNITAQTLFPGIDGLGRSMQEFCKLWDPSIVTSTPGSQ